eukprot:3184655-Amphidinium_carterae.1
MKKVLITFAVILEACHGGFISHAARISPCKVAGRHDFMTLWEVLDMQQRTLHDCMTLWAVSIVQQRALHDCMTLRAVLFMQQRAPHDYMTLWGGLSHAVMLRPLGLHDQDSPR